MEKESNLRSGVLRYVCLVALICFFAAIFRQALGEVFGSALVVDQYSHILLVLPISATLLYFARKQIEAKAAYSMAGAVALVLLMAAFAYASRHSSVFSLSGYRSLSILFFAGFCLSSFLLCFGVAAFRVAAFPLLFLVLMVPLPDSVLQRTISLLQDGSADATCALLSVAHVPYVRHGVVLALPKIDIEIAQECSGIRSSLILFLSSLVLGHLFLNSGLTKLALTIAVIPLTVAKNGLRIFVLSTLGMYVDPSFLTGRLHHEGGILFFALAFASLLFFIWLLQKLGIDHPAVRSAAMDGHPTPTLNS